MTGWGSDGGYGGFNPGGGDSPSGSQYGPSGGYNQPQPPERMAVPPTHNLRGYFMQERLASWPFRVGAAAIDYAPLFLVWFLMKQLDMAFVDLAMVVFTLANSVYYQATFGHSLGKRVLGLKIAVPCEARDGHVYFCPPGYGRCVARLFLHIIDAFPWPPWALCIGLWRPLWQENRCTYADQWAKTLVFRPEPDRPFPLDERPKGSQVMKVVHIGG